MNDCIFCKLANGEIPTKMVYQDDLVAVFMDANPNTNGHMLVVPRKHVVDFTEIDDETLVHIHKLIKEKLQPMVYKKLGACGLKIVNNYGSEQQVKHYHVHVIPFYEDTKVVIPHAEGNIDEVFEKLTK